MSTSFASSRSARGNSHAARRAAILHKPNGQIATRVQAVGPERFGIVSIDGAKARSLYMLCDFYGRVLVPPTVVAHTQGDLGAAIDRIRQAWSQHNLGDGLVALERTGEYHRPAQRAFQQAGFETRVVHPLATKHFRQPVEPGNKTDATDLAAIHRATVNGFGLFEPLWPDVFAQLRLLVRHRRDLVRKAAKLQCQIREHLHALMPGYAECFSDLWQSHVALPLACQTGSADAVRQHGLNGLAALVQQTPWRCQRTTLAKILAWAETAPPAHPQTLWLSQILSQLHHDWLQKNQQIHGCEQASPALLAQTSYLLLLALPGINVVSAAELAGEMGPIRHYANANAITGRAGLFPARYQSDRVDLHGSLVLRGQRQLRAALLGIADNLKKCNHHFQARALLWQAAGKEPKQLRIKIAKSFSRLAFAIVMGQSIFRHPCCQPPDYILEKLLAFHREHQTPMPQTLADLHAAVDQLPRSARAAEAKPLQEELARIRRPRSRGPQPIGDILAIVLARLGVGAIQSTASGDQDPGSSPGGNR